MINFANPYIISTPNLMSLCFKDDNLVYHLSNSYVYSFNLLTLGSSSVFIGFQHSNVCYYDVNTDTAILVSNSTISQNIFYQIDMSGWISSVFYPYPGLATLWKS